MEFALDAIHSKPPYPPTQPPNSISANMCVELTTTVQLFWRITFDKAVIYILIFMMDKCDKPGKVLA